MPVAMAAILAVIFSNIASRLEQFIGRFASSALVVITVVFAVAALTYFLAVQLTAVAVGVTDHSENIAKKISAVQGATPEWLAHIEYGVTNIEQQLQRAQPKPKSKHGPTIVEAAIGSSTVDQVLRPAIPILSDLTEGLLVIVLFFFLLYGREDLRYRLVRLTARVRVTLAAEAISTAGGTVSHYLLLFSLVNLGYGSSIAIAMWAFGLPNPVFWGAVAFLLRFIPYVGALISAVLPTAVAIAVFPGWSKTAEVFGAFILLDQVASQFVEPFLIGRGIGLSPLALLFSAMFWAWLWGLPGLLLATPLTSCLKVAGDYIPALNFLSILLGADQGREDYHDYYRKLLEIDQVSARALAIRYCDENGLEPTLVDLILPALAMMGQERDEDHISPENQKFIIDTTDELIGELGSRFDRALLDPEHPYTRRVRSRGDLHSGTQDFAGTVPAGWSRGDFSWRRQDRGRDCRVRETLRAEYYLPVMHLFGVYSCGARTGPESQVCVARSNNSRGRKCGDRLRQRSTRGGMFRTKFNSRAGSPDRPPLRTTESAIANGRGRAGFSGVHAEA